ncbi:hypothetical protein [Bradyrhizobium sp. 6(2017)]|uniref:hypothetical protein n=1 Tax=Bradyrhizobium sp. 6(2017) TaxID=1197460 RepID=UPI0013E189B1|nr:hypothetical protein [Bradyrhizobium sp. 6(2017)]QIG91978.1 hypothetical protein G6P99_05315 [Bradyrhizobium sp. 6(2017)]
MHDSHNAFTSTSQPAPHKRAPGSVTNRSVVTNKPWALPGIDNRLPQARRFRDLCKQFAEEAGGTNKLSEAERAHVRQAATLILRAEALQNAQVLGELVDGDEAIRLSSEIRRLLEKLKSKGRKVDAERSAPDLRSYLAARSAGQPA